MQFKEALEDVTRALDQLAEAAGRLKNQNLSDIIKHGRARIAQASEHPDVSEVDKLDRSGTDELFGKRHDEY